MKRPKKEDENKVKYGTISLPLPLIKRIKKRIKKTGMNSVSAYVTYILREVLSRDKDSKINEETEKIRLRLKNLGY
ncbi:MAG: CopG family transcriptional regulator [Nanoarchaeota archaeon]|nr:CopG family transcriptional regulator [Nanoarchaeota archaeon]